MRTLKKSESILSSITDTSFDNAISRQKLKEGYISTQKHQLENYIKDLEKSIEINKSIIVDLTKSDSKGKDKNVLSSLNNKNSLLHSQIKNIIKKRDECQSKLLISEQIIAEYRAKDLLNQNNFITKQEELVSQLNKKEYFIQNYEYQLNKALALLSKYELSDPSIKEFIKTNKRINKEEKFVTNLVAENLALSNQLKAASEKIMKIEMILAEIIQNGLNLKSFKELKNMKILKSIMMKAFFERNLENNMFKDEKINIINEVMKNQIQHFEIEINNLNERIKELINENNQLNVIKSRINQKRINNDKHRKEVHGIKRHETFIFLQRNF